MSKYDYKTVKVQIEDRVARVILNRPEKRNAMNPTLHAEMDHALAELEFDNDVGVVIITGAGGNFSAGMDLREIFQEADKDPAQRKRTIESANRWRWERLCTYEKPTIAMVRGYCVGGAFMQLLGCDFAFSSDDARFSLSEVNWGVIPGGLVAKVVSDALLPRHALYHACVGDAFSAAEAERIGLINRAVPEDELDAVVLDFAQRLLQKSPYALRATKIAIRNVRTMDVPQAYEYLASKAISMQLGDPENSASTGLRQFLDDKTYKPAHGAFRMKGAAEPDGG